MKNIFLFIFTLLISSGIYGQVDKTIIEKGIKKVTTYEQRLENGLDKKYVIKEVSYNAKGFVIELKETSRKGEVKVWEKYKYNTGGNKTEEQILDHKGRIEKKIIIKYENGLKTGKEYYDSEDRLYKKKTYEYEY